MTLPHPLTVDDLALAIERRELTLVYQPQMTPDGKRIVCLEALVRWNHPAHGVIGPLSFIDLAQRDGLIDALGLYVLDRACRDAQAWPDVGIAVNISPTHFVQASFVDDVVRVVADTGMDARRLEVEITESAAFEHPSLARMQIERLHTYGVRVSLDDFGTGYSSLSLLQALPFDKIKIDKAFISGIPATRSVAILQATIALVRALGAKVTAEGVETAEQQLFLKSAGCHYLQGYYFSRPVEPKDVAALLQKYS